MPPKTLAPNVFFDDQKLHFIIPALDVKNVQSQFQTHLSSWLGHSHLTVHNSRLVRYKAGKRCLIEYDVEVNRSGVSQFITWIGKVRAKGLDRHTYELQCALWQNGFSADSPDGISVPEPIGTIPDWQMWLQRKVPGTTATSLLSRTENTHLAHRIAEAIHKLHQSNLMPHRHHGMEQELAILHDRLGRVVHQQPQWQSRLEQILQQCDRLAAQMTTPQVCGIHRDFYPDQVLVDSSRIYLLDLDLYTNGDPGLDIGNFNGHLIEHSIRFLGNPEALTKQQNALTARFTELAGETTRRSIQVYTLLTMVRHIYLSTQFPERRSFTEQILDWCEQQLSHRATKY
ncbi:aminoglycoside phosphotransferase [filamentous cyanobacterium CCP2]|nr:aminoglycoside phosphotransferase [filamentous cyanobacterium CCP2]